MVQSADGNLQRQQWRDRLCFHGVYSFNYGAGCNCLFGQLLHNERQLSRRQLWHLYTHALLQANDREHGALHFNCSFFVYDRDVLRHYSVASGSDLARAIRLYGKLH